MICLPSVVVASGKNTREMPSSIATLPFCITLFKSFLFCLSRNNVPLMLARKPITGQLITELFAINTQGWYALIATISSQDIWFETTSRGSPDVLPERFIFKPSIIAIPLVQMTLIQLPVAFVYHDLPSVSDRRIARLSPNSRYELNRKSRLMASKCRITAGLCLCGFKEVTLIAFVYFFCINKYKYICHIKFFIYTGLTTNFCTNMQVTFK